MDICACAYWISSGKTLKIYKKQFVPNNTNKFHPKHRQHLDFLNALALWNQLSFIVRLRILTRFIIGQKFLFLTRCHSSRISSPRLKITKLIYL
jgi:hypothetical protein